MRKALFFFLTFYACSLIGQVSTYPYAEGWETSITWTQSTADDRNWTRQSGGTTSSTTGPSAANEGTNYVYVETSGSSANQTAILEQDFNLSGLTNPLFTFDYHMYFSGSASGGTLKVDVSDDGGTTWCNLWSKTGDQGNTWHDNEPIALDGYGLGTVRLRFHFTVGTNNSFHNDVALDDLNLVDAGSGTACQVPICFISSNIQPFSVDLTWSGVTTASSGYNVIYGSPGFDPKTTGTNQAAAGASSTISGLSAGTGYEAYLYSNCGAANSDTVGPISFTTALTCQAPTALGVTNLATTSVDLSWTAGGTETTWDVEYGAQGFTQGAGTLVSGTTTNPHSLSGLSSSTDYDFYVRADCGTNGTSPWSGPFSFTTAFQCPAGAVCGTYTSGDIDSEFGYNAPGATSACPGQMSLTIPAGDWIDSVDVFYDMTAINGAYMSEQRTWMYCATTSTGEASVSNGSGGSTGTFSYNRNSLSLANTATGTVNFELHVGRTWGGSGCDVLYNKVDDGTWLVIAYHSLAPSCTPPNTLTATNVTATTADLGWTSTGTETLWDIEYGLSGFAQGTGTMVTATSNNPHSVSGLTSSSNYQYYVRANCGGTTSNWAGPYTFTTAFQCPPNAVCGTYSAGDIQTDAAFTSLPGNSTCQGSMVLTIPAGDWIDSVDVFYDMTAQGGAWRSEQRSWLYSPTTGTGESSITNGPSLNSAGTASYNRSALSFANTGTGNVTIEIHGGRTWPANSGCNTTYNKIDDGTWLVIAYHSLAPSCTPPNTLTATNVTATTADLGWTSTGTETLWDIEYGAAGFTQGAGTSVSGLTSTAYNLTSLTSATSYEFYVRADCGSGTLSSWAGPFSFATSIQTPQGVSCTSGGSSSYILDDDLETGTGWTGDIGSANGTWDMPNNSANSGSTGPSAAHSGSFWAEYEASGNATNIASLVSPAVDLSAAADEAELSFYMHAYGSAIGTLNVGIGSSATGPFTTVFTQSGQLQTADSDPWQAVGVDISAYLGQTIYVEFSYGGSGSSFTGDMAIDLVRVESCVSCAAPTNLGVSNLTANTVDLTWTAGGTETQWDVEYGASGFTQGSGTMVSGTSTNPHNLTGLSANTTYDYYVRADCGGSTSGYAGPFTFSTPCVAFTAPYTESFDAASLPACWAQSSTSGGPWTFTSPGFGWNTQGCAASPSDNTGNSGNYAAMDHSSGDVGVIMEMNDVDVSALTTAYLEFYFWMCGSGYSPLNILHVEAYDGTTWNNVATIQQGTSGWESFGFDVSSHIYGANLVKLRFRTESGGSGSDFYGDIAIDDVSIMEAPSCLSPSSLSATNITTSAADLGWVENGTATAWILEYGTSGFSQGAGTTVLAGSNPYNLTGLSSDTEYDYYVRAFCAVGDSSSWIGPFTFRTLCNPFTAPYSQNFDGETAPAVNSCWTVINTVNLARLQTDATPIGTSANSSPNAVEFYNYTGTTPTDQILVSPMFSDLDNTKRIKFFLYDYSNTSDMIIGTMSDPNNAATFSPFDTITEADMDDDAWEEFTVSFASYTGSDKYIAFAHGMNTTFDYIHLDDFQYLDIPSCPEPTFLTSANITNAGVDFGWTESGSATSWQVSYGTTGTTAMAGTKMVVATNPFSISGLTGNTGYDLFVRSICAVGDTSIWVGPISISTLCDPVLAPWSENFDNGGTIPACWNQGSANVENWRFSSGSGAQYGPTSDNTSGSGYYAWIDDSSPHNTSTSLESPSIDLSGLAFPLLRFQLWSENHGNTTTFELNVDINSGSGWVLDSTFDIENTGWELQSLDLSAYTGQTIQIRFRGDEVGTGFQKDIAIDDVEVIETPNCPDPSGLSASNVSQSEADIDWTENGTATAWDIEYGAKGFSPTGTPSNAGITKPYTITGLSGAMAYDVYVRAACGGTDGNSGWVGPIDFTTLPDTAEGITCGTGVTSVLFSEDFENNSAGWTGSINSGNGSWEIPDGATSSGTGANAGFGGGNYMNYEASSSVNNNGSIVSPAIDLSGAVSDAELSFYMHAYGSGMGTLNVGIGTDPAGPFTNEFTWTGQLQTSGAQDWANVGIDLTAYLGSTIYVQFTQYDTLNSGGSFSGDMSIDELSVSACVSCPAPSAFTTDTVGIDIADFSWTENGSATTWLLEYGASGFSPGSGTEVSISSNPYSLTGLTENTAYDVYLRSYCAVGDTSTRVGPLSFTTLCAVINSFPYTQNFDGLSPTNGSVVCATTDALGDCWSNEGNTDDKDWVARSVATGSSNTGPSSDNTGGGNYLFIETSGCYNQDADLYSPVFDFTSNTAPRLIFNYHMYGAAMGSLNVAYSIDSGSSWSAPFITISGDQGNSWNGTGALLLSLAGEDKVIFRFRATSGTNFTSDIAIDDITVDEAPQNDVGASAIAINGDGCGTNQALTVDIGNYGAATQTSIPVAYTFNGSTITETWTGSLAPGASAQYTFTTLFDASAAGNYNLSAYTVLATDADNNNDTSFASIVTPPKYSTDYRADFESGLPTDWSTDGSVGSGHNAGSAVLFRNLYSGVPNFTSTSARFENIAAGDVFRFNYRYSNWSAGTVGTTLGAGDTLKVLISTDCGANWTLLDTIHAGNHTASADVSRMEYDMSAYAGDVVTFRFAAERGTGDYYLDIDEFYIGEGLSSATAVISDFNGEDISCHSATDGEALATAMGGVMPYTYEWDVNAGNQLNDTANGLGAGEYFVTITDAQGYEIKDSITLVEPDTLTVSVNATNPTCAANFDGALDLTINGGTLPYTISWADGPSTEDRTAIDTGSYTITITDANGCSYTDTYTLIIEDVVLPTVVSQNINAYLDASGNVSIQGSDMDNGSSDNCGIASFAVSPSAFTCAEEGANTVTLTVTDINGNQNTATATVTVMDTTAPTAVCQNLTVYLDATGNASITASDMNNGSSDNCTVSSTVLSKTSFSCADEGANTVTLTVTDQAGNASTCSATVTVMDTTAPTAVCQDLTLYLDASGSASITAADVDNGSSDNCTVNNLAISQTSFNCSDEGLNVVVLTVTDQAGNSSTCTANITVMDTVSPTAISQNINAYLDGTGQISILPSDIDNGSSDNCTVASLSLDISSFTCADEGANTVILTVTDQTGNSSTASATVMVIDTVSPTAVCQNITVYLDAAGQATISTADIDAGSTDNCSVQSLDIDNASFTCADEGANTVTLTVTDQAGNQSTCTSTVTVVDTIPPTAVCQNLTIYLDASGAASITAADMDNGSSDNCTVSSLSLTKSNFSCADLGSNTVVLTVTDQAGNASTCAATVTVMDTIAPTALSQNLTIYLDGNGAASITANDADNGSSDNCSIVSRTVSQTNYGCSDLGANTIIFTTLDQSGNQSSSNFTVTVVDTVSPTISTRSHTVYLDASGNASVDVIDVSSGTSNACSIDTVFLDIYNFNCSNVGANTVTVTAQATGGSASNTATATVTVVDTISPVVNTQSLIMYLDANGQTSINTSMVNSGSTDACGIASFSLDITSFDCSKLGNNTVVLTATDVNGNSATNTAIVEVRDTIRPVAKSRDLTVYLDATGSVTVLPTTVDNGSTDNCGITPSLSQSTFGCGDEGLNQEYLIITDADGNKDSTDFLITVLDTISPSVITRNITVQLGATGLASISPNQLDSASSDNCSNQLFYTATKTSFNCGDLGTNTITLTATDVHGNSTSKTAIVTVEDNIAPTIQTQPVILSLDASGSASLTAMMLNNGSSDNCAIDSMWISQESFDCSHIGSNSVTLFARDASGNQNSSAVIVTVQDLINPVAQATNLTVYLDASGNASIVAMDLEGGSTDNCGINSRSIDISSFNCSNVGNNTVTLTVSDASGNSNSSSATVTVMDTISPSASAKNIAIALDATGNASISASDVNDGSSDACGIASLNVSPSSFDCSALGLNTVVLTVTDNNGNVSTTTAQVTVSDNRAPTAVAQNTTIYVDANGNASLTSAQVDNGSSDNCAISTYALSKTTFSCGDLGNNTVVLTVSDASGNSANTAAIVTVMDTISPSPMTQNINVYLDASGSASISAGMIDNGSSDNCSLGAISLDISSFDCSNVGANTVMLSVNDASGNSAMASATVTVIDTISPNVLTQNITVSLDANGNASISTSDINNGSSDACGVAGISLDMSNFTCANLGSNMVTLTVTDNNGNSQTGMATVTVLDNMAPNAIAQNITIYLDANGSASTSAAAVDNGSSDNCAVSGLSLSQTTFGCSDLGLNAVTLTVSDASGNSSTATANVTVLDTVSPLMSTQNINAYLDANGVVAVSATAVNSGSTDNCGISSYNLSATSFTCSDVGANTVILTATDASGNSSTMAATITVIDTISPNAVAQNISVSLDANGAASIVASNIATGSSDACGIASMSVSPSSFTCSDVGANTVTLTITDVNGNTSTATSTVTVQDNIAPTVVTQAHTVYLDASGSATIATTDINNGSTDNCSIATYALNISSFDCSNVGQNLVTLTVTDANGNSANGGAIVTVLDTISPTIANTPANITAYSTAGSCGATVSWPTITGNDNCNISGISSSISSGSFFNTGTTTVVLTANDPSGNSGSSSFTVTVVDTIAPVFTSTVSGITITPNTASCDAVVTWTSPTATDNCSGVTYSSSHSSGGTFALGTTTVTVTATDADGNNRTVSFDVTVSDIVDPTISNVPANITVGNDAGSCDAVVNFTLPTVSDNCTGATITSSHASGSTFPLGTTTVSFTATDGAGNTSSASFEITVNDQEAPVFTTVPPSDTVGQCGQIYTFTMPSGTDNCTGLLLVRQTAGLPSGSVFPPGATTNTFEISDPAGNTSTTSFTIVVVPQGQPQLPNIIEACVNDPAVNITLGQSIVWSGNGVVNNGTTFDPATAGTGRHLLSYVFTDSMSCNASGTIVITVLPKPVTPVINKIGSTTLQTGIYNSYQWYRDGVLIPGANTRDYTYSQSGNFQVEVSNTVGCFTYSAGFVVGTSGGGIGLQELDLKQLEVYPNPSNGKFNIELNVDGIEDLNISLYSLDGRKVFEQQAQTDHDGKVQVDVGHLPTANYFLYIRTTEQVAVRKMLMK